MDPFTRADLQRLIQIEAAPCVSLYLPTHRAGREIRGDALRCKNLLIQAEEQLRAAGLRTPDARGILQPAWRLYDDDQYWRSQSDSLAMFAADGWFRSYRVPLAVEELAVVSRRFHVRPMLPLLQGDGVFYLLAASQNRVRLFRGTRYSISELAPDRLPKNLVDALNIDEYVSALQHHSMPAMGVGASAGGTTMFHGHGGADPDVKKKDEIEGYFHRIDAALREFFTSEDNPLVFAGVEYLLPIFRRTNSYRHLLAEPVVGNPDELSAKQLHERAWTVVGPHFGQRRQHAVQTYVARRGGNLTASDLETILAAVRQGRVETLLVSRSVSVWGTIDDLTGRITHTEANQPGADDLYDYAAVEALLRGSTVFTLANGELPEGESIAAVYRYAAAESRGGD
jgi:hypothetical protein